VGLTYYGMLAADRLGLDPPAARSFLEPRRAGTPRSHEARRAAILVDAGWGELARAELLSWLRGGSLEREERVLAAELLHRLGDHFSAVRQVVDAFGGNLDQGVDPLWRDAWQFAWPEPYGPPVQSATREFEFDRALVYAIMREESLYRPQVESAAGARGLMQLIPPTASRIARALDVSGFSPENLYQPDTNIRFGTYHLKELLEQFDGSRAHAIAAYNAGPEAVQGWLAREGPLADDAFVDSVPYGETRRYLRRVLRSYRMYRLLYAEPAEAQGAPSAAAPSAAQSRAR
jgi:soluble lytic murein transglycosylase